MIYARGRQQVNGNPRKKVKKHEMHLCVFRVSLLALVAAAAAAGNSDPCRDCQAKAAKALQSRQACEASPVAATKAAKEPNAPIWVQTAAKLMSMSKVAGKLGAVCANSTKNENRKKAINSFCQFDVNACPRTCTAVCPPVGLLKAAAPAATAKKSKKQARASRKLLGRRRRDRLRALRERNSLMSSSTNQVHVTTSTTGLFGGSKRCCSEGEDNSQGSLSRNRMHDEPASLQPNDHMDDEETLSLQPPATDGFAAVVIGVTLTDGDGDLVQSFRAAVSLAMRTEGPVLWAVIIELYSSIDVVKIPNYLSKAQRLISQIGDVHLRERIKLFKNAVSIQPDRNVKTYMPRHDLIEAVIRDPTTLTALGVDGGGLDPDALRSQVGAIITARCGGGAGVRWQDFFHHFVERDIKMFGDNVEELKAAWKTARHRAVAWVASQLQPAREIAAKVVEEHGEDYRRFAVFTEYDLCQYEATFLGMYPKNFIIPGYGRYLLKGPGSIPGSSGREGIYEKHNSAGIFKREELAVVQTRLGGGTLQDWLNKADPHGTGERRLYLYYRAVPDLSRPEARQASTTLAPDRDCADDEVLSAWKTYLRIIADSEGAQEHRHVIMMPKLAEEVPDFQAAPNVHITVRGAPGNRGKFDNINIMNLLEVVEPWVGCTGHQSFNEAALAGKKVLYETRRHMRHHITAYTFALQHFRGVKDPGFLLSITQGLNPNILLDPNSPRYRSFFSGEEGSPAFAVDYSQYIEYMNGIDKSELLDFVKSVGDFGENLFRSTS